VGQVANLRAIANRATGAKVHQGVGNQRGIATWIASGQHAHSRFSYFG